MGKTCEVRQFCATPFVSDDVATSEWGAACAACSAGMTDSFHLVRAMEVDAMAAAMESEWAREQMSRMEAR